MTPVQPEELSALIDGELDPQRAREVEAQIAADPALKREFEELSVLDGHWRDETRSSGFPVQIRLPFSASWGRYLVMAAVVVALLGVRAGARLIDPWSITLTLQGAALIGIFVWLGRAARRRDTASRTPLEF